MPPRLAALVVLSAVTAALACATLRNAQGPAEQLFDCVSTAFEPLAGTRERAEELTREVESGRVDMAQVLDAFHATETEALALRDALSSCAATARASLKPAPVPAGDAGVAL